MPCIPPPSLDVCLTSPTLLAQEGEDRLAGDEVAHDERSGAQGKNGADKNEQQEATTELSRERSRETVSSPPVVRKPDVQEDIHAPYKDEARRLRNLPRSEYFDALEWVARSSNCWLPGAIIDAAEYYGYVRKDGNIVCGIDD